MTDAAALLESQRAAFLHEGAPDAAARRRDLDHLARALRAGRDRLVAAIDDDFGGRSRHETLMAEVLVTLNCIAFQRRHLGRAMKNRRRAVGVMMWPGSAFIAPQPKGVIGIMSPWNYPAYLALGPLATALAAGNRALLKPSEQTPATNAVLARMLGGAFPPEKVALVEGGPEVAAAFAGLPFDHLVFTGGTGIGRKVMAAAAAHLTPLTLELGGKSPALVAPDADLTHAARAIARGKMLNAGQTCIAPDHVLVPRDRMAAFADEVAAAVAAMYPGLAANPDYSAILQPAQRQRLRALRDEAVAAGATAREINPDGQALPESRIAPTLLLDPPADSAVMREEIFGPLLPLLPYDDLDHAIAFIASRPRPLALYLFTANREIEREVLARTHAGGVTVNDTVLHAALDSLPFGGIGPSGQGSWHGPEGFDTLSHLKPVYRRYRPAPDRLARPPYGKLLDRALAWLLG